MKSKYEMIPMKQAFQSIDQILPSKTGLIPITDAQNLVCSQDIYSPSNFPQMACSVMDGYAVQSQNTPGFFAIQGGIRAGDDNFIIQPGSCCYITTGAPLPQGADAVVPIQKVTFVQNGIQVPKANQKEWVRQPGQDIQQGQLVLPKNSRLRPSEIAILISLNITQISVFLTPKIGLLSSGDQLRELGEQIKPYQIVDSNKTMLKMLSQKTGCKVKDYGIVKDDWETIKNTILLMSEQCDIIITSGGVSMGDKDLIKPILESIGEVIFGRVHMKPGKPCTLAKVGSAAVFGLPGNPVSCFVCFYLFVNYCINKVTCRPEYPNITVDVGKTVIRLDKERPEYHRVVVEWDEKAQKFRAVSTGSQMSSRLMSTAKANALLVLPQGSDSLPSLTGQIQAVLIDSFQNYKGGSLDVQTRHTCQHFTEKKDCKVGILTVSDRASQGLLEDTSGEYLEKVVKENFSGVVFRAVVPDEREEIKRVLVEFSQECELVISTGGTGFTARDVTPEATLQVVDRTAPGIQALIYQKGFQHTLLASLSRGVCGIRNKTLIINMPGSLKGVMQTYEAVKTILPHAISLINS